LPVHSEQDDCSFAQLAGGISTLKPFHLQPRKTTAGPQIDLSTVLSTGAICGCTVDPDSAQSRQAGCHERHHRKKLRRNNCLFTARFLFALGVSYSFPSIATWLAASSGSDAPTVGGFLYATLASLAVGLVINATRWVFVQEILLYGVTRLPRARINYGGLTDKNVLAAFNGAIENNYRYYQYYSNAFVSIVLSLACYLTYGGGTQKSAAVWVLASVAAGILFVACRNELAAFNKRAEDITNPTERDDHNERVAEHQRQEGGKEGREEEGGQEEGKGEEEC
jgi:hypothetical protein